jgi:hypothetical protein
MMNDMSSYFVAEKQESVILFSSACWLWVSASGSG